MDSESQADSDRVRKFTTDLERLIWQAVEYGEQCAHTAYAEWKDKKIDTETFNNIVRHRARRYLEQHGPTLVGWALDRRVSNNGISVIAERCHSKVIKAVHGSARDGKPARIPALARSRPSRAFMMQVVQPPLFPGLSAFEDALCDVETNLLFMWDHDDRHHVDQLWLVKPKSATKARVLAHWQVRIPNPLLTQTGQVAPMVQEVSDDLNEEIQLPLESEDETGTEE